MNGVRSRQRDIEALGQLLARLIDRLGAEFLQFCIDLLSDLRFALFDVDIQRVRIQAEVLEFLLERLLLLGLVGEGVELNTFQNRVGRRDLGADQLVNGHADPIVFVERRQSALGQGDRLINQAS